MPTLRFAHKYTDIFPQMQVDKGAIKHILTGSHIMCPGLTSEGAKLLDNYPAEKPVLVTAEGKTNALAVGKTSMSTTEIKNINEGIGIEVIHHLGDALW